LIYSSPGGGDGPQRVRRELSQNNQTLINASREPRLKSDFINFLVVPKKKVDLTKGRNLCPTYRWGKGGKS